MSRPMRIALADDEAMLRDLMTLWLSELGHEVTPAADGRELVRVCRDATFDMVISDVSMPHLDGLDAVAELRRGCAVPVVLASGAWTDAAVRRATALGAVCVDKPLRPLTLVAAIARATGGNGATPPARPPAPRTRRVVAHDARNAVTCLLNYALWLKHQEIDATARVVGEKVDAQARRLVRLVEELTADEPSPCL